MWVSLGVFLLVSGPLLTTAFTCIDGRVGHCSCENHVASTYSVKCPYDYSGDSAELIVTVKPQEQVLITCNGLEDFNQFANLTANLSLGLVEQLEIINCPAPDLTADQPPNNFASLVYDHLGANEVVSFSFRKGMSRLDPEHFANMSSEVRFLTLNSNDQLGEVDATYFASFPNLTRLELNGNRNLRLAPDTFKGLTRLQHLQLLDCNLGLLDPNQFAGLTELEELNMFRAGLSELPANLFAGLRKLSILNLEFNRLQSMPDNLFDDLASLSTLRLSYNNFERLPDRLFAGKSNFTYWEMKANGRICKRPPCSYITRLNLQPELFEGSSLTGLKLLHVPLQERLPGNLFSQAAHLDNITIQSAAIDTLPDTLFASLKTPVKSIDLSGNPLTYITDNVFKQLNRLKTLRLRKTNLSSISKNIFSDLIDLEVLHLHESQIRSVHWLAFKNLVKLQDLNLASNQIILFDDRTAAEFNSNSRRSNTSFLNSQEFEYLEVLDLSRNQISYIEESLVINFLNLQRLDLSYNRIKHISILDMVFIKNGPLTVDLSYNVIERVNMLDMLGLDGAIFSTGTNLSNSSSFLRPSMASAFSVEHPFNLILDGNPIRCDCFATELKKKLLGEEAKEASPLSKIFNIQSSLENVRCGGSPFGDTVNGKALATEVDWADLVCPFPSDEVDTNCTDSCECSLNRYTWEVVVNCSGRSMATFPSVLPVPATGPARASVKHPYSILLDLSNNDIVDLHKAVQNYYNRSESYYQNIERLILSNNGIKKFSHSTLPPNLRELYLDGNQIGEFQKADINYFDELINRTNLQLKLGGNPYVCTCESQELYFLIKNRWGNILDKTSVTISCTTADKNLVLYDVELSDFCSVALPAGIIVGGVIALLFLLTLLVAVLLYICYRETILIWIYSKPWAKIFFPEEIMDSDKPYDAFVSYNNKDSDYVYNVLLPGLENPDNPEYKYRCLVHERDWKVGEMIPTQILDSVTSSKRTIIVLTKDYVEATWTKLEFAAAHSQSLDDRRQRVILIVKGALPPEESLDDSLLSYIRMNTYLKADDNWFWEKLRYALPHRGGMWKRNKTKEERKRIEKFKAQAEYELQLKKVQVHPNNDATPANAQIQPSSEGRITNGTVENGFGSVASSSNGHLPAAVASNRLAPLQSFSNGGLKSYSAYTNNLSADDADNLHPTAVGAAHRVPDKRTMNDKFIAEVVNGKDRRNGGVSEGGKIVRQILKDQMA